MFLCAHMQETAMVLLKFFCLKIPYNLIYCSNETVFQMQIKPWILQEKMELLSLHYHTNYNYFIIIALP